MTSSLANWSFFDAITENDTGSDSFPVVFTRAFTVTVLPTSEASAMDMTRPATTPGVSEVYSIQSSSTRVSGTCVPLLVNTVGCSSICALPSAMRRFWFGIIVTASTMAGSTLLLSWNISSSGEQAVASKATETSEILRIIDFLTFIFVINNSKKTGSLINDYTLPSRVLLHLLVVLHL